jgi:hypothetical protein
MELSITFVVAFSLGFVAIGERKRLRSRRYYHGD